MSALADVRPALIGHLKELHLPTVRDCYEDTARRAERETLSYEQYLLEVITRECEQRRKSRVQRLLRESALPLEKSLENFNVKRLPMKAQRQQYNPCPRSGKRTGANWFWPEMASSNWSGDQCGQPNPVHGVAFFGSLLSCHQIQCDDRACHAKIAARPIESSLEESGIRAQGEE